MSRFIFILTILFSLSFIYGGDFDEETSINGSTHKVWRSGSRPNYFKMFSNGLSTPEILNLKEKIQKVSKGRDCDSAFTMNYKLALLEFRLCNYESGMMILRKLNDLRPNQEKIIKAFVLGFELMQNYDSAFRWINTSYHPKSSMSKIHFKILELLKNQSKDYASILNLGSVTNRLKKRHSLTDTDLQNFNLLKAELIVMLEERIKYKGLNGDITSQLLLDLGHLVMITESLEKALEVFAVIRYYDCGTYLDMANLTMGEINIVVFWSTFLKKEKANDLFLSFIFVIALIPILLMIYIRRNRIGTSPWNFFIKYFYLTMTCFTVLAILKILFRIYNTTEATGISIGFPFSFFYTYYDIDIHIFRYGGSIWALNIDILLSLYVLLFVSWIANRLKLVKSV